MSSFNGLILHAVVITPVCQWLLSSPRFPRPRNFLFAIAFLAAVAMAGEFQEWQTRPSNYYRLLDVDRSATAAELKRAYRDASVKYHPDKNKSPDAPAMFQAISEAHEVLNDADSRKLYERYGPAIGKDVRTRAQLLARAETDVLMGMASFYLMWAVLTYLTTIGKTRAAARTWSFIGLVISAFLEFQMMFANSDPLGGVLTRTTTFEKIGLLHAFYAPFMHGCILIAQFIFVDLDTVQLELLKMIAAQNNELGRLLAHLVQSVDKKGGAAVVAGAAPGRDESEDGLTAAQRMQRQQHAASQKLADAQQKKAAGGGIPGWAMMIGLYVLFNYVLK